MPTSCCISVEGFRVSGLGFRVSGSGFKVSGLGFKVSGLGFRVRTCLVCMVAVNEHQVELDVAKPWLKGLRYGPIWASQCNVAPKTQCPVFPDFACFLKPSDQTFIFHPDFYPHSRAFIVRPNLPKAAGLKRTLNPKTLDPAKAHRNQP